MKSVAASTTPRKPKRDFYRSTLAPVDSQGDLRFCAADAVMLIVLFLEIVIFARLFLAN